MGRTEKTEETVKELERKTKNVLFQKSKEVYFKKEEIICNELCKRPIKMRTENFVKLGNSTICLHCLANRERTDDGREGGYSNKSLKRRNRIYNRSGEDALGKAYFIHFNRKQTANVDMDVKMLVV